MDEKEYEKEENEHEENKQYLSFFFVSLFPLGVRVRTPPRSETLFCFVFWCFGELRGQEQTPPPPQQAVCCFGLHTGVLRRRPPPPATACRRQPHANLMM